MNKGASSQLVEIGFAQDGATPESVYAQHASEGAMRTGAVFTRPAGSGLLTIDGRADPLRIDFQASGDSESFVVATADAGPHVWLSASGGVPSRLVGSVSGGLGSDCSGASAPVRTTFTTLGSGSVGRVFAQVSDEGAPPAVPAEGGVAYACPDGKTRGFAASLPALTEFEMNGGPCTKRFVLPADSAHLSTYDIETSSLRASLKIRLESLAALVTVTVDDDFLSLRTDPEAVIATLAVDFSSTSESIAPSGVPCLNLGAGLMRSLSLTAADLGGRLDAQFGEDDVRRKRIALTGAGAEDVSVTVVTDPPAANESLPDSGPPCGPTSGLGESTCFNLAANMPIRGNLDVKYHEAESHPPGAPSEDTGGNYAILANVPGMNGGVIRVVGFDDASLILDRVPTQTAKKAAGTLTYHTSAAGRPLAIALLTNDGRVDAKLGGLSRDLTASFDFNQENVAGIHGWLNYEGAAGPVEIRQFQADVVDMVLRIGAPGKIDNLTFRLEPDARGDPTGRLDLIASGPTPLYLNRIDEWGATTTLDIDAIPRRLTGGEFTITTCGVNAKLSLGGPVGSILFTHAPTTGAEKQSSPHVTPGCPVTPMSTSKGDDGATSVFAHLRNLPAGDLDLKVMAGSGAGNIEIKPLTAPIGRIEVDLTTTGEKNSKTHVIANDVTLRVVQWDIDGHTNYPGMPKAVFVDSAGATTGRIILDVQGEDTLHIDSNGRVYFQGFQFKLVDWSSWRPGQKPLELHAAGCMKLLDANMDVRLSGAFMNAGPHVYFIPKGKDWRCW